MILGITGVSGAHKSGVSRYLRDAYGMKRLHAGMPVKRAVRLGFGLPKAMTAGKAKDMGTDLLGGAKPRALMEAFSTAAEDAAPHAISEIMRRRIAGHVAKGRSVVVDGLRTPHQAWTIKSMGGFVVRADNGKEAASDKPTDKRSEAIDKIDYTLDTSGNKAQRKVACDKMLEDLASS